MKKLFLGIALFVFFRVSAFSCDDCKKNNYSKMCPVARVYIDDTLPEFINGDKVTGDRIRGVVYFDGFDFGGYESESDGIEPMLKETLNLLRENYAADKTPFVFLGHSQGGLRSLAMSTYLKENDPELYKQLKGVVTFSGIDKGLKLLENRGANFRAGLYTDFYILSEGVYGTIKFFDFTPGDIFSDFIISRIIGEVASTGLYAIGDLILCEFIGATKGFAYPILNNNNWNNYAQIRDMCPQSDFVKKYVLEEKPYYYKVPTGSKTIIVWKKGWLGIPYPTLGSETVYSTITTTDVNMKVDKDLPLNFVIGTHNDTLSMAGEDISHGVDVGMNIAGGVFRGAQVAHIAKCVFIIGLLTNSPVYAYDCGRAADWCYGYKNEINELLGEASNDGLVAASSQQLPESSKVGSSAQTKILNKSKRVFYCRNHADIVDAGSPSRNRINDYADEMLGITNRSNKKR